MAFCCSGRNVSYPQYCFSASRSLCVALVSCAVAGVDEGTPETLWGRLCIGNSDGHSIDNVRGAEVKCKVSLPALPFSAGLSPADRSRPDLKGKLDSSAQPALLFCGTQLDCWLRIFLSGVSRDDTDFPIRTRPGCQAGRG